MTQLDKRQEFTERTSPSKAPLDITRRGSQRQGTVPPPDLQNWVRKVYQRTQMMVEKGSPPKSAE